MMMISILSNIENIRERERERVWKGCVRGGEPDEGREESREQVEIIEIENVHIVNEKKYTRPR